VGLGGLRVGMEGGRHTGVSLGGLVVDLHVGLGFLVVDLHVGIGGMVVDLHVGLLGFNQPSNQPSVLYAPTPFVFWLLLFSSDESSMYGLHSSGTAKFESALLISSSSSGLLDSYAVAVLMLLLAGHGLGVGQLMGFLVGHSNFGQFKGHDS